jgi:hypothetical protein
MTDFTSAVKTDAEEMDRAIHRVADVVTRWRTVSRARR